MNKKQNEKNQNIKIFTKKYGRKPENEKPNSKKIRKLVAKKQNRPLAGVSKIELSVSKR